MRHNLCLEIERFGLPFFRKIYFDNPDILCHHWLGRPNMLLIEFALLLSHLLDSKAPTVPMECTNQHQDHFLCTVFPIRYPLLIVQYSDRVEYSESFARIEQNIFRQFFCKISMKLKNPHLFQFYLTFRNSEKHSSARKWAIFWLIFGFFRSSDRGFAWYCASFTNWESTVEPTFESFSTTNFLGFS